MSLRTKITLVLLAVIGLYGVASHLIQERVFFNRFETVEKDLALDDLKRVQEALSEELRDVEDLARGWAHWDALYHYVDRQDPTFVLDNLSQSRLQQQKIDLLFVVGESTGELRTVQGADDSLTVLNGYLPVLWSHLDLGQDSPLSGLSLFPREAIAPGHPFAGTINNPVDQRESVSGILMTEHRPLLVSAHPIRRSSGGKTTRGALILGRFLGDELNGSLASQTNVEFSAFQADGRHTLPEELATLLPSITSSPTPIIVENDPAYLDVYGTYNDIRQRPEIVIHAKIPSNVLAVGRTAIQSGLLSTITGGVILLFVLLTLLRGIVLVPLSRLTQHAQWIGKQEDFRAKLGMDRNDELGVLSHEFDRMMEQLEDARSAYVETARSAGMSQVATGILHNVGNVLSSVNVATDLVSQRIQEWSVTDLEKLSKIVEEHSADLSTFVREDKRGQHLQPFLSALAAQMIAQRDATLEEVSGLSRGVEHICELVKSQQNLACAKDLREPTDIGNLIDDAAQIAEQSLFNDPNLIVVRDYQDLPDIEIDRHRVLEILVNLITNARQAMDRSEDRQLSLRLFKKDAVVHVQVQDTGKGISQDKLSHVFHAGYTTKQEGMGFGLHSSANAATEFQGKLYAHSEGEGLGATFTLEIPYSPSKAMNPA